MFPSFSPGENQLQQENVSKWKGIFTSALKGVQKQVHPTLSTKEDALEYIETLMIRLLITLCASQPHSIDDVDDRILKTFPDPIDKWAMRDAQNAIKDGKKNSSILLPVDKIHPLLKDELGYRVDISLALYITAVLEYIAADILKISGIYVKNIRHLEISSQDIKVAICADQVLYDMFFQEEELSVGMEDEPVRREMTYEEIVKDLIMEETQYLRDLNMIIRVFRAPFVKLFPRSKDPEIIFSNILEIYDFSTKLISSVEDQVEMAQEGDIPLVGTCFTDLTEGEEFSVYERYVHDMLAPNGKARLRTLLMREDVIAYLMQAGNGFREAFKYVLPKLLMGPIYHCLQYFDIVKALIMASPTDEDRQCLTQADGLLQALKARLERKLGNIPKRKNWELSLRLHPHSRSATVQKMTEIQKSIDGWDGKDIIQMCSEFIMEGPLTKVTGRRTNPERYCFLFDGLIILCKPTPRRTSGTGPVSEYKLKEKFLIRKVEVVDKEDSEDLKNAFEIHPREHMHLVLQAKTVEEKTNWMAALVSLQTRSMLERSLDSKLREEEKNNPLVLPQARLYEFAVEDSSQNIIFEDNQDSSHESPLIKGGQLIKLVERLTYHMYADPRFLRTFLLTYRSFCSSRELLDLLVKRFEIPEPVIPCEMDDMAQLKMKEDLKRFRNEYVKPVQFRVANVFRHWVDNHFYDFERDPELLDRLKEFLLSIKGKAMRKMADIISKSIQRKQDSSSTEREFTYQESKPKIEWFIARKPEDFNLMTLHPIEIARQVTLLEFDLYRAIKPSELVGMPWMKKDKQQTAPNLLKMIHFSTNFTYWLELFIVETSNLEERVAVVSRVIEVMLVFQELNNFNGVLEVIGALNSASVFRLEHTKKELPHKYQRALEDASELNNDHFKKYIEKLRSINPPCVPFLGMYLTNILKTEEGNPDFVANAPEGIINFSKRRKVAEITGEIQQYQNQPYCLDQENSIREFFAALDPLKGRNITSEKDLEDYLYKTSLEIEPRDGKLQRFPKKFHPDALKSPGIKPSTNRHGSSTKSTSIPPSLPKMSEEEDSSQSACATPTSPNKPQSPIGSSLMNNVFANSP
ncbi:son of sevenless 2, partial [Biomphalaria pfeifferi]